MKIIHITAECYPIAKVGGLADVAGALPKYQNNIGAESSVLMPFYDNAFTKEHSFKSIYNSKVVLDTPYPFRVLQLQNNSLGYELYLIDIPELLFTNYVYSEDDTLRFLAFQQAGLQWLSQRNDTPEIVHCHDYHTGLIPFMMSHCPVFESLRLVPSVLTIHNAQYQGWFSHDLVDWIPEFSKDKFGLLDWDHCINPLAAAIKCAWRVTTVSPSYMEELMEKANGLESLLKHERNKCIGVLNGIDTSVWNPETDPYLIQNYPASRVQSGKKKNKAWLCKTYGLDSKRPLFVFIGRLVGEKGADLFSKIFTKVLKEHKISVLLLGSGNESIEKELKALKTKFKGEYNAYIGYDEQLSHRIYAGADFLLMPSRVEPCGLNQMYSLRYGTIPIVNSVGGLIDTVVDIDQKNGFGIRHSELSVEEVYKAINRGVSLYNNEVAFRKTRVKIMKIDHSWDASAQAYVQLYESIK